MVDYSYKVFESHIKSLQALNELLETISTEGWEPVNVDFVSYKVFARKPTILND